MAKRSPSPDSPPTTKLDSISEWRVWQTLLIYFTVLLNRQVQRHWLLELQCMQNRPFSQQIRPFIFLEPIPDFKAENVNTTALETIKQKTRLVRARIEKGKELASEIERRSQNPRIALPTHFCHTCIIGGERVEVLLTQCGHRVCLTCLGFGMDGKGNYECSICFAPAQFVTRSPLGLMPRSRSGQISSVPRRLLPKSGKGAVASALCSHLVKST